MIEFSRKVATLRLRLRGDELLAAITALRDEQKAAETELLSKLFAKRSAPQPPWLSGRRQQYPARHHH